MAELPSNIYLVKNKEKIGVAYHVKLIVNGHRIRETFNFNTFGGERQAYLKAREFLHKTCEENNVHIKERSPASEIPGVSRTESFKIKSGQKVKRSFWQATWQSEPGKQKTRRFWIEKHGEEKAKKLAIEARNHAENCLKKGKDPIFIPPKTKKAKLWRYMDFTKFVSMVDNSGIFFCQADNLGDPYEGSYSRGNEKRRNFVYSKKKEPERNIDDMVSEIRHRRKGIMVSCWHNSSHESAAMWKLYSKSNEAVCIQTTYERLAASLGDDVNIGMVNYIDYENSWIPESSYYYPFVYKRKSFEHERELRALIDLKEYPKCVIPKESKGFWKEVDLNYLIQKVYVAPDSPEWFLDLTKNMCRRFGLKCDVVNSRLIGDPIF